MTGLHVLVAGSESGDSSSCSSDCSSSWHSGPDGDRGSDRRDHRDHGDSELEEDGPDDLLLEGDGEGALVRNAWQEDGRRAVDVMEDELSVGGGAYSEAMQWRW